MKQGTLALRRAVLQSLEPRLVMSTDPFAVLGTGDYVNARAELKASFTSAVQADLTAHIARQTSGTADQKFDKALLELMRAKAGAADPNYGNAVVRSAGTTTGLDGNFFFANEKSGHPDAVQTRAQAIRTYDGSSSRMNLSDDIGAAAGMPVQAIDYNQLIADPQQSTTGNDGKSPTDRSSVYRFNRWRNWAEAYRYERSTSPPTADTLVIAGDSYSTNAGVFVRRITDELADWSSHVQPTDSTPSDGNSNKNDINYRTDAGAVYQRFGSERLDFAGRIENFSWVYPMVMDSTNWTGAANTLFLYETMLGSRYLLTQAASYNGSMPDVQPVNANTGTIGFARRDYNKIVSHAKSLVYAGDAFKEFAESASWKDKGHDTLFNRGDGYSAIGDTLYDDGGHREQSGTYWRNTMQDLAEVYALDKRTENGDGGLWSVADLHGSISALTLLSNSHALYYDFLQPDNQTHVLGEGTRGSSMEISIAVDGILASSPSVVPDRILTDPRWLWVSTPSTYPIDPSNRYNYYPENRGYTSVGTTKDSGNFVVRSNVGTDTDARSIFFRGGDLSPSPARQPTTLGYGAHSRQDLLSIDMFGDGIGLVTKQFDADGHPGTLASDQSLMTVAAHNNTNLQMRQYDVAQPGTTITARGRWDSTTVGQGVRDYVQATSWHDAWKADPKSGSNADVSRSVWMLTGGNYSSGTTRAAQQYGTSVVMDYGTASVTQDYDVHFHAETHWTFGSNNDVARAIINDSSTDGGIPFTQTTVRPVFLPGQSLAGNGTTHLEVKQSGNSAVFANIITTKVEGQSTPPSFVGDWQVSSGANYRLILLQNAVNVGSTGVDADAMWAVNYNPTAAALPSRDAFTALEAERFDKAVGIRAIGTTTAAATWNAVTGFDSGNYLRFERVDFGSFNADRIKLRLGVDNAAAGKTIEVRLDSTSSTPIATLTTTGTGGYSVLQDFIVGLGSTVSGVHDVYITGGGTTSTDIARIDLVQFVKVGAPGATSGPTDPAPADRELRVRRDRAIDGMTSTSDVL